MSVLAGLDNNGYRSTTVSFYQPQFGQSTMSQSQFRNALSNNNLVVQSYLPPARTKQGVADTYRVTQRAKQFEFTRLIGALAALAQAEAIVPYGGLADFLTDPKIQYTPIEPGPPDFIEEFRKLFESPLKSQK